MNIFKRPLQIIKDNRVAFIINVVYFGLVAVGMVAVIFAPEVQTELINLVGQNFAPGGSLEAVGNAYGGVSPLSAAALTFVVNFFIGSLATITLPSLVVPFSGLLMGIYRAILWGLLLSPAEPALAGAMIPHSLTLILEGEAYVLALLAVYVHGKAFLLPRSVGAANMGRGYLEELKQTGWLYVLVAVVLVVAAIYEALEVIYLVPLFQ